MSDFKTPYEKIQVFDDGTCIPVPTREVGFTYGYEDPRLKRLYYEKAAIRRLLVEKLLACGVLPPRPWPEDSAKCPKFLDDALCAIEICIHKAFWHGRNG